MTYPDQCGSTLPHPPHGDCPGLSTVADPLDVTCPDCFAPPPQACRTSRGDVTHAARAESAQLRSVEHGTCNLCGQPMVRGVPTVTTTGADLEAWHPDETNAAACPPLPDPATDWNGYATAISTGISPGRPGMEHFVPVNLDAQIDALHGPGAAAALEAAVADGTIWADHTLLCPECAQGKCQNCTVQMPHPVTDELVPCEHSHCDGSCGEPAIHALHTEPLGL